MEPINNPDEPQKKPILVQFADSQEFKVTPTADSVESQTNAEATETKTIEPEVLPDPVLTAPVAHLPELPPAPVHHSHNSLFVKLMLVILLPIYASLVIGMAGKIPYIILLSILATPVVFLASKKVRGIFLPYAVGAGVILATHSLLSNSDRLSKDYPIRDYIPLLSHHGEVQILLAAIVIALISSLLAFFTTNYTNGPIKIISNLIFRFLAVWLILYFPSAAHTITSNALQKAQHADYVKSQDVYNRTSLDENVPVYTSLLPAYYQRLPASSNDASLKHKNYTLYFAGQNGSAISVNVSLDKLPPTCENTMTPRIRSDSGGQLFTCNIVEMASNGQAIYGYRDRALSDVAYQGIDPASLKPDQIKQLQPDRFYIQKENTLLELTSSTPNSGIDYPLTPQVMDKFASNLGIADAMTRKAFVDQYIKPVKPVDLSKNEKDYKNFAVLDILIALYLALFLWAMEKVFQKAGRQYWKVYVPVVNLWILTKIAGRPGWWSLLAYLDTNPFSSSNLNFVMTYIFLLPVYLPFMLVLTLIRVVLFVLASTSMAEKFGKPKLFSLLLMIPPFPGYLILGFGKSQYDPSEKLAEAESVEIFTA